MAAIIWYDVVAVAPELGGTKMAIAGQTAVLAIANYQLDVNNWGGEDSVLLHEGRALYAAHLATMMLKRGLPGAVTSSAAGGLSRGYGLVNLGTTSSLQLTSYGILYLELLRTTPARGGTSAAGMPTQSPKPGWGG